MKYYKKVAVRDGKLLSAVAAVEFPEVAIEYKVGEFVKGHPGTNLFVFNDFERAKTWGWGNVIYECEIEHEVKVHSIFQGLSFKLRDWLLAKKWHKKATVPTETTYMIHGAVACKRVKLLKRVWPIQDTTYINL